MPSISDTKSILTELISIPVLGGQPNARIAGYITDYLKSFDVEVHVWKNSSEDKQCLLCRIGPAVDGGIILSGHMDVVPAEGQPWTVPAFNLTEKDEKWYGRGTADMKGFLACCMAATPLFRKADLKKPVYFAFSTDEEIGCLFGRTLADYIRHIYIERPLFAVIGEASMMQTITGHKGICVAETTVNGSAGHSSRILTEVSAVHVAAQLVQWLEYRMKKLIGEGRVNAQFYPNHSSMHAGRISGGIAPNVIADHCYFQWDVRVIPGDDALDLIADFENYCRELEIEYRKRFPGFKIETRLLHPPVPPLITSPDSELVRILNKINNTTCTSTVAYAAEAGQFSEAGYESVICGPGDIAQAHRADEYVEVSQIEKCLKMMEGIAHYLSE